MKNLLRFFNTLRFLKPIQFGSRANSLIKRHVLKKIIDTKTKRLSKDKSLVFQLRPKSIADTVHCTNLGLKKINFLNNENYFKEGIDWNDPKVEKLWLYNLHYFEYLLPVTQRPNKQNYNAAKTIIEDWIKNNPIGTGNGWEPYPLSLRIVNWIYFYSAYSKYFDNSLRFKKKFLTSLYHQAAYLTHFLEFHILANHLYENVKTLLMAGIFFQKEKWIKRGWKLFEREVKEQLLPDGGHYERSPMYHSIILLGILDVINIIQAAQATVNETNTQKNIFKLYVDKLPWLKNIAEKMIVWLRHMQHPDGGIALFGDSALNIAPTPIQIEIYYQNITKKSLPSRSSQAAVLLKESGYAIFRNKKHYLVIDGGELGVRYQPGHSHCDLLSYEYSYSGLRFIVDSGVGNYRETELRHKARSIYSHNTVVVNGLEQAEIWKVFRVGRWVKPENVLLDCRENKWVFTGKYENRLQKRRSYSHTRRVKLVNKHFFYVTDEILGEKIHSIESLLHFHPECHIEFRLGQIILERNNCTLTILWNAEQLVGSIKEWFYVPEFGKVLPSKMLILQPVVENPIKLCYVIAPHTHLFEARTFLADVVKQ